MSGDTQTVKTRYALVGTGGRCVMFYDSIYEDYSAYGEVVGLCDVSQTRMGYHNARMKEKHGVGPLATYGAEAFDAMVLECRPDVVIVTTMDSTHHEYVIRAMELGCDVITEKPMTIDAAKANAIKAGMDATGKKLTVTFNYRYAPGVSKMYEMLHAGAIGKPTAVDFTWLLDTAHGADYFRRWHRHKEFSGGLLVHKSTHHFDLVNWWLRDVPETVFAMGDLAFYGKDNAAERGERYAYDRYTGHVEKEADPFALTLDDGEGLEGLYLAAEKETGYIRDQNVFGEGITAEDTMAVVARYRKGVILNYSLKAYCPWEGYRVSITGTKGRLELDDQHGSHIIKGQSDEELAEAQAADSYQRLRYCPMFKPVVEVEIPHAEGGHGGGDPLLLAQLFDPEVPADPLGRGAGFEDGAASILMGIAANESIRTGQAVKASELIALP